MKVNPTFELEKADGVYVLTPVADLGELDRDRLDPDYESTLKRLKLADARQVIVDLHNVDYCGSSAISFFLNVNHHLAEQGGEMVICNVSEHVRRILEAVKLDQLWTTYQSRDEALKSLGR